MYLGIDMGTSGVKALLIDDAQLIVAESSSRSLSVERPKRGWSEQSPDLWWDAVCEAVDGLKARQPAALASVKGIGLSGQMYGATVLDAADRPLRPAILWNDTRSDRECMDLLERAPEATAIACRKPTPGVTAPKLAWLKRHEPDIFGKIHTVLLPKDYVRLKLTGEKVSDVADASGTYWMDVANRDWSDRLLAATDMDRRQMPRLAEGVEATGTLRAELKARWGIEAAAVVAGGGSDNACGACGSGIIRPGVGTISLGTSGVLFVATEEARPSLDHAIESLCHSVPGVWHQMAVILSATACLTWLSRLLKRPVADLVTELGTMRLKPADILFVPYLDGCWSPTFDVDVRGAFVGLEHMTDDAAMTHAVLQGVAFALTEAARGFRANGATFDRLLGIGGGSRSRVWLSMLADCLDTEIAVPEASELGAAFGAARLGLIAATGRNPSAVLTMPKIVDVITPDRSNVQDFHETFARWHGLVGPVRAAARPPAA